MLRLVAFAAACTTQKEFPQRTEKLYVEIKQPSGVPLPKAGEKPLPLLLGQELSLLIDVVARGQDGLEDKNFNGFVRLSVEPGSIVSVSGSQAVGRNVLLKDGRALGQTVRVLNARGPTRFWAEDIGYVPADANKPPRCSDGVDNDQDGKADFPDDPGCAFANDDTETTGTFAAGVSSPVRFEKPKLGDLQGRGAVTPFSQEGVDVLASAPSKLIVTRIAADGFYATDVGDPGPSGQELANYNHIFAFTFGAPRGLRVCDQVTQLSGTAVEFFGFTELSFPSFDNIEWRGTPGDGTCPVPEPWVIPAANAENNGEMEKVESALVRLKDVRVGSFFGPEPVGGGGFSASSSNCDLNGNGFIEFNPGSLEGDCANQCGQNPECVEWTGFAARGNYRVIFASGESIQINTRSISELDPVAMRGKTIKFLTGTLRNFSGGSLNWTVEARCPDDLVCDEPGQPACENGPKDALPAGASCVFPRTDKDPNDATN